MTKYTRENPIQERAPQERIPQTPPRQTSPSIEITGLVIANTDEKGDPIPSNQAEPILVAAIYSLELIIEY